MIRKTETTFLVLMLTGAIILGASPYVGRVFPRQLTEWGPLQWEQMHPSDRYFYAHGHLAGAWTVYNIYATELDAGRSLAELEREMARVRLYVEHSGGDVTTFLENFYENDGRAPMAFAPYLLIQRQENNL